VLSHLLLVGVQVALGDDRGSARVLLDDEAVAAARADQAAVPGQAAHARRVTFDGLQPLLGRQVVDLRHSIPSFDTRLRGDKLTHVT